MSRAGAFLIAVVLLGIAMIGAGPLQTRLLPQRLLPVIETLGGDFTLPSTRGGELALASLRGHLVLLNFGFTSCPDVCPTVLARMRAALLALGPDAAGVQPLFVSIDPERDTLAVLTPYVAYFHPALIGLRGSVEETARVAALYKVYYERTPAAGAAGYGFLHSDQIYLLDRRGRVRATFGSSTRDAEMVATMRRLLDEPG